MLKFACFSPHPPMLLPNVGSKKDKGRVKKTIESLEILGKELKKTNPGVIVISSPHEDWGFNVPLHFLVFSLTKDIKTKQYLVGVESPQFYFEKGKEIFSRQKKEKSYALIASGDLSHCLKDSGPYGFHPDGPKFDKALIEALKKKDIKTILKLDDMFPGAGECGLRPLCLVLGILEASKINWQTEVLSYEAPFGVGYLVAKFKLL